MSYLFLKMIHIISSTVLFGTGLGTASVMLYAHWTKNPVTMAAVYRYVVLADWVFTASSAVVQPLTGLWMVYLAGYSFSMLWIWGSIVGYLIAAFCWFPVVFLQIRMRQIAEISARTGAPLPAIYYRYFRYWFLLGWPAFISLLMVFYLMTFKPTSF